MVRYASMSGGHLRDEKGCLVMRVSKYHSLNRTSTIVLYVL